MPFPQKNLENIEPATVQELVGSLGELYAKGKPETDEEVERRINQFFVLCQTSSIRPGIESLSLALGVSRQTLYKWSNGDGCSQRRQEAVKSGKRFIWAFIEQCNLSGKINPASGIFLLKNWLGYKDTLSFEEASPNEGKKRLLSREELAKLGDREPPSLP